jgi:hypothetical protein
MTRIATLVSFAVAILLSACASPTAGTCTMNSVCPIVIYEKYPGHFATYPDDMAVTTGGGTQTLVWTFADSTKYKFLANNPDYINGDGVELIGANGSRVGMTSCFITKNSRPDFKPAIEGTFYRCEMVAIKPDTNFGKTHYRIRFHANDGTPRMVDPTVSSTGSGDNDDDPMYTNISVNVGDDVLLPPKGTGPGIRVIWNSAAGAVFRRSDTPMVFKDAASNEVDIQPCTPSTTADGKTAMAEGQYYTCIFSTPVKPLTFTYDAKYTDGAGVTHTQNGKKVTRLP